jgi:glucosamine-phosphate N-acetyltransferase
MDNIKNISVRAIKQNDMEAVIELLQSISEFKPSKSDFLPIWVSFSGQTNVHSLVAIMDDQVVGYGSIVIEKKIRGGKMGHIEDIVSHPLFKKKGIGKSVLEALFDIAKENDCYKVGLQCKEHNIDFYQKCGYKLSGVAMQILIKKH